MVKSLSGLFIYFCMTTAISNVLSQNIACLYCIFICLSCIKPTNIILMFDIQCLCKLTECFLYTRFSVDIYGLGFIGMLSVYPSGVYTIYASMIALY